MQFERFLTIHSRASIWSEIQKNETDTCATDQ